MRGRKFDVRAGDARTNIKFTDITLFYRKKVGMKKIHTAILLVLLVSTAFLSACNAPAQATAVPTVAPKDSPVISEGHLAPRDSLYLSFLVTGQIEEILVEPGDPVIQGQVLARLGDRQQADASLTAAQLELTAAQQAYDELLRTADQAHTLAWQAYLQSQGNRIAAERAWDAVDTDDAQTEIDDAEETVQDRKTDLEDAQDEADKYKDLAADNTTRTRAEDDLKQAQLDYNEAVRKRDELILQRDLAKVTLEAALAAEAEARRTFDNTHDGPDPDQLALSEARLKNAKAQVSAAQSLLDKYDLKSPFDGIVADVNVSVNETVSPEKWVVLVADFSQWYVETSDLTELEVVKIAEGQTVEIKPDALDELALAGTVESISLSYKSQSGDIIYLVKILLDEVDPRLRWGMTVEVIFK